MTEDEINPQVELIKKAIEIVGTQQLLAEKLKLRTQAQVSSWATGRRPVPPKHCQKIEKLTRGKVSRYDLCPEVFGKKPVKSQKQAA